MPRPPERPRIYHITHVDNLASIVADGGLVSDRIMASRGGPAVSIGMPKVKNDRLSKALACHPGDMVGDYVPFNFCPRSVMLYVISRGNHPAVVHRAGQGPIVHLEADFHRVVDWADSVGIRWAFTDGNARTEYGESFASRSDLAKLDWPAIANNDFRDAFVQQAKQAEFLMHKSFPWELVDTIGTHSLDMAARANAALAGSAHTPNVIVERTWYF